MTDRDLHVLLYGATGYTGRLIAQELDAVGAAFAVAGRDEGKLNKLARRLDTHPEVVPVPLTDAAGLTAAASRARVVISAAGPYVRAGPPVLDAAIAAGSHFADITGEQSFLRYAWSRDEAAKAAGVTVVNALGFDVVPSDFAAATAARGLNGPVASLDLGIWSDSPTTRGTRLSMAESAPQWFRYQDGAFVYTPPGRFARSFDVPDKGPRDGAFIPWGDCVTAPRSTGAATVRTFFILKSANKIKRAWPLAWLSGKVPGWRGAAVRRARKAKEGPDGEKRAKTRFMTLAEAVGTDGSVARAMTTGRDPYGLTGASAAHGALALARGDVAAKGVLTPSQAFDIPAYCEAMKAFEMQTSVLP